ncbi:MAG: hypothetical protein ACI9VN_003916, partial [Patescibacteria group bacterium]
FFHFNVLFTRRSTNLYFSFIFKVMAFTPRVLNPVAN